MAYTNSTLVNHTRISPNRNSPRKHAIDTITIHCVVGQVSVETLGRGFAWLDTGNHDMLLAAADFVSAFQKRQGLYISCIEEIAYKRGFIDRDQLIKLAQPLLKTDYGKYLMEIAEGL